VSGQVGWSNRISAAHSSSSTKQEAAPPSSSGRRRQKGKGVGWVRVGVAGILRVVYEGRPGLATWLGAIAFCVTLFGALVSFSLGQAVLCTRCTLHFLSLESSAHFGSLRRLAFRSSTTTHPPRTPRKIVGRTIYGLPILRNWSLRSPRNPPTHIRTA
jgi:hypothetical protein